MIKFAITAVAAQETFLNNALEPTVSDIPSLSLDDFLTLSGDSAFDNMTEKYIDKYGKPHPIWAKPLFDQDYKSFDELFQPAEGPPLSKREIYMKYMLPIANCLHEAYLVATDSTQPDRMDSYTTMKMECYKAMVNQVEELRGLPLTE